MRSETSSIVAGWKNDRSGGLKGGGKCGDGIVEPVKIEVRSLWILSEKNVAKDCGRELRLSDDGNEGAAILWSKWFIVCQSFLGL